jgi:hypothetical protein
MDQSLIYPWMQTTLEQLSDSISAQATLICGPEGIGKRETIMHVIQSILRSQDPEQHPDLKIIKPDGHYIPIDAIRAVIDFVYLTPVEAPKKVVLVQDCHKMTLSSANALLKVLEEPPEDTHFYLLTSLPGAVAPTIRSRCRRVMLSAPKNTLPLEWLASKGLAQPSFWLHVADGAPLKAYALGSDTENQSFVSNFARSFLQWLNGELDLIRFSKALYARPRLAQILMLALAQDVIRLHNGLCERVQFKKMAAALLKQQAHRPFSFHWARLEDWRHFGLALSTRPEQVSLLQFEAMVARWDPIMEEVNHG